MKKNNKYEKLKNKYEHNPDIDLLFEISKDGYIIRDLVNSFIIFTSYNKLLYLIYSTKQKSIISYNLNKFQINIEIKNPHQNNFIINFRHYYDQKNQMDLIMSISKNSNIKIWNNNNWNCLLNINNIYSKGIINSACFIFYENNNYIVTSNNFWPTSDSIKIIDFEGKLIKKLNKSEENTYYIDSYLDKFNSNLYIISCNYNYVISYNYNKNEIYHKYDEIDNNSKYHCHWRIIEKEEIIKLIESANDGILRIWNYHSGLLLNKIYVCNFCIYGLCLIDKDNIFAGCGDNSIKLINIKNGKVIKNLKGCNEWILTIQIFFHEKYGDCLISQGIKKEQIKLWLIKDIKINK